MIIYNNKKYTDYIDLLYKRVYNREPINTKSFPHSDLFLCRIALEFKFKRKFKLVEVKELIKDIPYSLSTQEDKQKSL